MIASACREFVRNIFAELYPGCTVIYAYPGYSPRPPLPYLAITFEKVQTIKVYDGIVDGILQQSWLKTMPFTVELVTSSKISHSEGKMSENPSTALDDIDRSIQFIRSSYITDKSNKLNVAISATGDPEQVFNPTPGVERARCSFSVDYIELTKEYAALHPRESAYTADHPSAASEDVVNMKAGWFNEVEIIPQVND